MANSSVNGHPFTLNPCVPRTQLSPILDYMNEADALLRTMVSDDYVIKTSRSQIYETLNLLHKHIGYSRALLERAVA